MSGLNEVAKAIKVKKEVVELLFAEIMMRVAQGEKVKIKNFGTFYVTKFPGRTLTSPKVNGGKPLKFSDSLALKFRQSQRAKQTLNAGKAPTKSDVEAAAAAAKAPKAKKAAKVKPKAAAKPGRKNIKAEE